MQNQDILKLPFHQQKLVCVYMCDIHPLRLLSRVREREIERKTRIVNPRKDLRDFILTITEDTTHRSSSNTEYLVGTLVKDDSGVFFKPLCSNQLILLVSSCIGINYPTFIHFFNFSAPYGEIKFLPDYEFREFASYYPVDYATSENIRNLVLNHGLCIEIASLKMLENLADDGIWEKQLNEKYGNDYAKTLEKRKLFAQRNLVNDYVSAYAFYDDLDKEATKEERQKLIKSLFDK